jgi:hypothetical protein
VKSTNTCKLHICYPFNEEQDTTRMYMEEGHGHMPGRKPTSHYKQERER